MSFSRGAATLAALIFVLAPLGCTKRQAVRHTVIFVGVSALAGAGYAIHEATAGRDPYPDRGCDPCELTAQQQGVELP